MLDTYSLQIRTLPGKRYVGRQAVNHYGDLSVDGNKKTWSRQYCKNGKESSLYKHKQPRIFFLKSVSVIYVVCISCVGQASLKRTDSILHFDIHKWFLFYVFVFMTLDIYKTFLHSCHTEIGNN